VQREIEAAADRAAAKVAVRAVTPVAGTPVGPVAAAPTGAPTAVPASAAVPVTTGGDSSASGAVTPASGGNSTACAQPPAPVVLGQTLATSGLVGATIGGLRNGLAVWAKDINARGAAVPPGATHPT
jgi:branched-chain amino acid transport system substrate-binding protein